MLRAKRLAIEGQRPVPTDAIILVEARTRYPFTEHDWSRGHDRDSLRKAEWYRANKSQDPEIIPVFFLNFLQH